MKIRPLLVVLLFILAMIIKGFSNDFPYLFAIASMLVITVAIWPKILNFKRKKP